MGSYKLANTGRLVPKPVSPGHAQRGEIVLQSDGTGLYGGEDTEIKINGEVQQFDWEKAMLLVSPEVSSEKF